MFSCHLPATLIVISDSLDKALAYQAIAAIQAEAGDIAGAKETATRISKKVTV